MRSAAPSARRAAGLLASLCCGFALLEPVAGSVSLSLTDASAIQTAAQSALQQLANMYTDNADGVYDQTATPWFASGIIWDSIYDYMKWSEGDSTFVNLATGALANMSYTNVQDVLGGDAAAANALEGKWNDDILWPSLGIQNGAEIYGWTSTMPGTGGGKWGVVPPKTLWEVWQQEDNACGGGIYWSRNRYADAASYKSTITEVEFIAQAARTYLQNKNETLLTQAKQTWSWLSSVGLMPAAGNVYDGIDGSNCGNLNKNQWTYSSGQAIQAAVWMAQATGDSSYMTQASAILATSKTVFAPNNVVVELCEPQCNRDQKNFKAVFVRALAYMHKVTSSSTDKSTIENIISSSVGAMTASTCNDQWLCGGNWTRGNTFAYVDVADQHVSSSLLIAALGIYGNSGSSLTPSIKANQPSVISAAGAAGSNAQPTRNVIESRPLNSATSLAVSPAAALAALCLGIGVLL